MKEPLMAFTGVDWTVNALLQQLVCISLYHSELIVLNCKFPLQVLAFHLRLQ